MLYLTLTPLHLKLFSSNLFLVSPFEQKGLLAQYHCLRASVSPPQIGRSNSSVQLWFQAGPDNPQTPDPSPEACSPLAPCITAQISSHFDFDQCTTQL